LAAFALAATAAQAQEVLTIGVRSEAASLDPHWTQLSADLQVQEHIFEHLVDLDSASQPAPGLAVSWEPIDEDTWSSSSARASPGTTAKPSTPTM
jgi:peptide/nickel transport system substrate-binding protein